jgi:hypothetical protein
MCYYKVFVFQGCGHAISSTNPVRTCAEVKRELAERNKDAHTAAVGEVMECWRGMEREPKTDAGDIPAITSTSSVGLGIKYPHHSFSPTADQITYPNGQQKTTTTPKPPCSNLDTHPFQTLKIYRSCLHCSRDRAALLAQSESATPHVRFEDWRWKVKYLSPVPKESRYSASWGSGMGKGID